MKIDYSKCSKWKDEYLENGAKGLIESVIASESPTNTQDLIVSIQRYEADDRMYSKDDLVGLKDLAVGIVKQANTIKAITY